MGLVKMHFVTLYNTFHSSTHFDLNPTQAGEEERRLQFFKLFYFLYSLFHFCTPNIIILLLTQEHFCTPYNMQTLLIPFKAPY